MSFLDSVLNIGSKLLGGLASNRAAESAGNKNRDLQKDFAQQGVRWRVADAKAAGIHPLAAIGMNAPSASPSYTVGDAGGYIADMGQDISRAVRATESGGERVKNAELYKLQLENMQLQNEGLRLENQRKSGQIGPPMPVGVGAATGAFEIKPADIISANPDIPYVTAGPNSPSGTIFNLGNLGDNWVLPNSSLNEALEDMGLAKYAFVIANNKEKIKQVIQDYVGDTMAPVFGTIWQAQQFVEKAYNEGMLTFKEAMRYRDAINARAFRKGSNSWGREAR